MNSPESSMSMQSNAQSYQHQIPEKNSVLGPEHIFVIEGNTKLSKTTEKFVVFCQIILPLQQKIFSGHKTKCFLKYVVVGGIEPRSNIEGTHLDIEMSHYRSLSPHF